VPEPRHNSGSALHEWGALPSGRPAFLASGRLTAGTTAGVPTRAAVGVGRRGKDGPERGKGRRGSQVDAAVMAQEVGRPPFRRRFPVL
jgi:hypothetical protein